MKFPSTLLIISIIFCVLATYISASPTTLFRYVARSLSEWGIGHYGGTVSEISKQEALELERSIVLLSTASKTTTNIPSASTIATEVPESSSNEGSSTTTWSSTYTTTITVTATITVIPTATILAKREEGEVQIFDSEVSLLASEGDAVAELNRSFRTHAIALGDPCAPVAEGEEVDYKICVGGAVAICRAESLVWEVYSDCRSSGLVCGAMEAHVQRVIDKADIQCLEVDKVSIR